MEMEGRWLERIAMERCDRRRSVGQQVQRCQRPQVVEAASLWIGAVQQSAAVYLFSVLSYVLLKEW